MTKLNYYCVDCKEDFKEMNYDFENHKETRYHLDKIKKEIEKNKRIEMIVKVVLSLIGDIGFHGETYTDDEALENTDVLFKSIIKILNEFIDIYHWTNRTIQWSGIQRKNLIEKQVKELLEHDLIFDIKQTIEEKE